MTNVRNMKKRLVTSYDNLSPELKEEVKIQYPNGFNDSMMRIDKGADDFFYAIVLETDDINYLIKIDVKIDDKVDDDDDNYDDDEIKDTDDIIDADDDQFSDEN